MCGTNSAIDKTGDSAMVGSRDSDAGDHVGLITSFRNRMKPWGEFQEQFLSEYGFIQEKVNIGNRYSCSQLPILLVRIMGEGRRDEDEGEREEWARRRYPRRKYTSSLSDYRSIIIVSELTLSPGDAGRPHHHGHHASSHGSLHTIVASPAPNLHAQLSVRTLTGGAGGGVAVSAAPRHSGFGVSVRFQFPRKGVLYKKWCSLRSHFTLRFDQYFHFAHVRKADRQTDRQAGRNTYTTLKFLTAHKTRDSKNYSEGKRDEGKNTTAGQGFQLEDPRL
ncbi:hypothetical protein E2C01_033819 [Portunus trituberculatus]|uniref:Uncharacterized protein n=1 Tax=Portunus trituberculatus TaxID=210409 RepID=A0A5B7F578_PORTR|nr:hypothetical protein [Portunus trituberculatus]